MKSIATAVICSVFALAGSNVVLAGDNKVLNEIVIGQTPVADYLQSIKKRGCRYQKTTWAGMSGYSIAPGCYNLPAVKNIYVVNAVNKYVTFVEITYQKSFGGQAFNSYLNALKKNYGRPVKSSIPYVGNKSAEFKSGNLSIVMEEPHMGWEGSIMFLPTQIWEEAQKESLQKQANNQKELESLL